MIVRLDEICKVNMGQSPDSSTYNKEQNGLPFFQGNADFGEFYPKVRMWCSEPTKIANIGDILISVRAPIGALNFANSKCCIGRGLASIQVNSDKCLQKYLWYCLISKVKELNLKGTGSTFKAISKCVLCETEIPLPTLEEQKQIANTLDKVTALIDKHKKQLEKLDELVKARFVEMFGDPVSNPKGWECKPVIKETDCMVPGRDKPRSFTGHIPWITIEDLRINSVTYKSKSSLGLTQEEIEEVKRKPIPKGSVIMSCVGNLGICSIAGNEMIINQQLHSFQCRKNLNNVYLMYNLGYRKDYMEKWASSTTVPYMNKSICNSIPIMLAPIELQNQFADFVKQVEKTKTEVQKSLEQAEKLKKALMQKYFG